MSISLSIRSSLFPYESETHQHADDKTDHDTTTLTERIGRAIVYPFACLLDCLCHYNPVNHQYELLAFLPDKLNSMMGDWLYDAESSNEGAICDDPEMSALVEHGLERLIPFADRKLDYRITIPNTSDVNAGSFGNGRITINRGLIETFTALHNNAPCDTSLEDKVAIVIAHEMAHIAARHHARTLENIFIEFSVAMATMFVLMTPLSPLIALIATVCHEVIAGIAIGALMGGSLSLFQYMGQQYLSRQQEYEADKYALVYSHRSGIDLNAAIWADAYFALANKSSDSWIDQLFHSHPPLEDRLIQDRKTIKLIQNGQLT